MSGPDCEECGEYFLECWCIMMSYEVSVKFFLKTYDNLTEEDIIEIIDDILWNEERFKEIEIYEYEINK